MSLQECTDGLIANGEMRINAGEFSMEELIEAAATARETASRLIIYNLKGRTGSEIGSLYSAGGRQVTMGDIYLV
jgi:hypothetical protein